MMGKEWDGYDAAMEQTNSFNYEPAKFARGIVGPVYCWRCHRELACAPLGYCFYCDELECLVAYWGA
jgi:hypothetical protein